MQEPDAEPPHLAESLQTADETGDGGAQLFAAAALDGSSQDGAPIEMAGTPRHEPYQEVLDELHEFIKLSRAELLVLDHPAVMRLKRIKQLGLAELVFPTATHVRREHAIGTLHVAHLILEHLDQNLRQPGQRAPSRSFPADDRPLTPAEISFTRLAALLHDVGHLPSGHTFEDELGLLDKHDHRERLTLILDRPADEWDVLEPKDALADHLDPPDDDATPGRYIEPTQLTLRELIDTEYAGLAEESGLGLSASDLVLLLIAGDEATTEAARRTDEAAGASADATPTAPVFRLGVCRDIVGNTICADLIDYLRRDWQHLGRPHRLDRRLLQYMEIRRQAGSPPVLAVDLRSKDDVRTDAISSILRLLDSRYELFEMALYHRTKLNASCMLERVVAEIADAHGDGGKRWLRALPKRLLDRSDDELFALLLTEARAAAKPRSPELRRRMAYVERTLIALRQRHLHRRLVSWTYNELRASNRGEIQDRFSHRSGAEWSDPRSPARNRLRTLRLLEEDFELPPLSLGMYCPPRQMSDKVARVRVRVDEQMGELQSFEGDDEESLNLTGGRLRAQTSRFHQLWRIHLSCERETLRRLTDRKLRPALFAAIDLFVLDTPSQLSAEERIGDIIGRLTQLPGSRWSTELESLDPGIVLAHHGEELPTYPTGYPALSSFFTPRAPS